MKRKSTTRRVIGIFDRSIKAHRDKISGLLRFAANTSDWDVRFLDAHDVTLADAFLTVVKDWPPDAIITCSSGYLTLMDQIRELKTRPDRPIVVAMDVPYGHGDADAFVCVDDAGIATAGAELLLRRGIREFAFLGNTLKTELPHSQSRMKAFRERIARSGLRITDLTSNNHDNTAWIEEIPRIAKTLTGLPKPCGILAYSDSRATTIFDACRLARLAIPDQVAIVGVDNDTDICERTQPTLSSVFPDFEAGGFLAADCADCALRRPYRPKRQKLFTYNVHTVVERLSTQDVVGARHIANLAAEYLRKHFSEPVSISKIAHNLNVSVRLLEIRFHEVFNSNMRSELLRIRLQNVCQLLMTTDLTIANIAERCGFRNTTNLMILFKRRFNCPMRDYRRNQSHQAPMSLPSNGPDVAKQSV